MKIKDAFRETCMFFCLIGMMTMGIIGFVLNILLILWIVRYFGLLASLVILFIEVFLYFKFSK